MVSDLEHLKSICKAAGVKEGIYNNPRFLFTVEQVDNFYFYGNITKNDIHDGWVDGCGDGGIDFILKNNDDELYLIQGKTSNKLSKEDIHGIFDYMIRTVDNIRKNNTAGLKHDLIETLNDVLYDNPKINLVLFYKNTLSSELKNEKEYKKNGYNIIINDKNDLENQIYLNDPDKKVEDYTLNIDSHNNVLKYGKNGIIINISANSLKRLYYQKLYKGLFSYNLREKIAGKKVDDNIKETIDDEPSEFWYRNNGITIGCEKYKITNNTIKLTNFSIINGAQTTTNIGKSDIIMDDYDFYLPCKVITVPSNNMEYAKEYLKKISIATNYQKPITLQDIRANDECQKQLRLGALSNELKFCIITKRGTETRKDNLEQWKHINNIELAQLIFSCIDQNPGPAKSSSKDLMDKYYDTIFNREHNFNLYYDMIMLYNKFLDFKNSFSIETNNAEGLSVSQMEYNSEIRSIIKEGVWTILACVFRLIKLNGKALVSEDCDNCNFNERIFDVASYEKIDDKIYELFKYLAEQINIVFKREKVNLGIEYSSYFLKNQQNYLTYVVPELESIFNSATMSKQLKEYLKIFK